MATTSGDRTAQFPLIERRYGQPISFWLERLGELEDTRYATLMSYLQEEHGFSRAHANTVVMYARGSTSTKRFATPDEYISTLSADQAGTVRSILDAIQTAFPDLETVIAWNNPMLRRGTKYVMGVAAATEHVLILPWGDGVLDLVAPRLAGLTVKKKSIQVPLGWTVDEALLRELIDERLRQIDAGG